MSAPVKPVKLEQTSTYIHITSSLDPSTITEHAAEKNVRLQHKGPIGELDGEHIFEVLDGRTAVARDTEQGRSLVESALSTMRGSEGVKGAQIMETKQRAKRG
jgi:hypothetical protein